MEKLETVATKIDSEFLLIRKELKEIRDGHRDNHASQIYMKDDTPMCEPPEANYVQGYHDQNSNIPYFNQNRNPNRHYPYPRNIMPHLSQYFKTPKTLTKEMMREWMARYTEANERMKDQVVELEKQISQGLRNRQAIIENLERQFAYLEKIQPAESLPHTTNTKPRHELGEARREEEMDLECGGGTDQSCYYSQEEDNENEEEVGSCYSQFYNSNDNEEDEEIARLSSFSDCSVVQIRDDDHHEYNNNNNKNNVVVIVTRDCRICQLSVDDDNDESQEDELMELGCCCKDDLAFAHKHCADTWFKIKGNKICEICNSIEQTYTYFNLHSAHYIGRARS
nr:hypothetical protein [Tanacetum cinerariifolium]